jgi:quercetin dioxygenase-like cupin family protein
MSHSNHNHDHEHEHAEKSILPAVEHPAEKVYEDPRKFVREIGSEFYDYRDHWEELRRSDKRVIKGSEIPMKSKNDLVEGSQHWGKSYVRPWVGVTQSLSMHMAELAPEGHGKKHGHQNEALMYILEGEGYEIHDGVEYKWEPGNLVVIHGGCVHQHFSADQENPCKALIVKPKALYQFLHLLYQGTVEHSPEGPAKFSNWTPPEDYSDESEHGKGGH